MVAVEDNHTATVGNREGRVVTLTHEGSSEPQGGMPGGLGCTTQEVFYAKGAPCSTTGAVTTIELGAPWSTAFRACLVL